MTLIHEVFMLYDSSKYENNIPQVINIKGFLDTLKFYSIVIIIVRRYFCYHYHDFFKYTL
jgi:hypothetical protein